MDWRVGARGAGGKRMTPPEVWLRHLRGWWSFHRERENCRRLSRQQGGCRGGGQIKAQIWDVLKQGPKKWPRRDFKGHSQALCSFRQRRVTGGRKSHGISGQGIRIREFLGT